MIRCVNYKMYMPMCHDHSDVIISRIKPSITVFKGHDPILYRHYGTIGDTKPERIQRRNFDNEDR